MEARDKTSYPQPKRRPATGHEIPLSSMIAHGYKIKMTLLSGRDVFGYVRSFDKYTVTINRLFDEFADEADETPTTFFKHAIESFTRV